MVESEATDSQHCAVFVYDCAGLEDEELSYCTCLSASELG